MWNRRSMISKRLGGLAALVSALVLALTAVAPTPTPVPGLGIAPPQAFVRYGAPIVAIEHVRVIDGTGAAPRADQTVIVEHGKIASVGAASSAHVPAGAQIVDGHGYTLTPGFVGTHNHLYYVSGGPLFIMREMPFSFPRLYLASGVTSIRTAGSVEPQTDLRIKDGIDRGILLGPHIDVTSPYMTGYEPQFVQMGELRSPQDARETVNFWADRGVTSFKLYTQVPPAIARAVIAAAHARHLKVLGHLCSIGSREAVAMGIDSLEHGLSVDTEFFPGKQPGVCPSDSLGVLKSIDSVSVSGPQVQATIHDMVAHHVSLSSTLAVLEGRWPGRPSMRIEQRMFALEDAVTREEVLKTRARILANPRGYLGKKSVQQEMAFDVAFYKAGGLLTQGPDPTGYGAAVAGIGDQHDMELLVEAGLTPVQAIQVATRNGAIALGRADRIGTIAAGKNADLVLIHGNPAANIQDIENVEVVFKDGVGYDSAEILDSIRGIVGRQ
jgi:imidazolonepropionase-like amidohydrolase